MALVPGLGWVGSLNNSKTLSRSWDKDKVKIANLCKKFDHNSDYRLVTPWYHLLYIFSSLCFEWTDHICNHIMSIQDVDVLSGRNPYDRKEIISGTGFCQKERISRPQTYVLYSVFLYDYS